MPHILAHAFAHIHHVRGWLPLKVDKKGLRLFKHADGRTAKEVKSSSGKVIGYRIYRDLKMVSTATELP